MTANLLVRAALSSFPEEFVSETTRSGGGSSLFSMESLRWEAPNPKLQAPEKFQGPNFNAPSWMATTTLDLGLELGAWCLVLRCAPYSTENSEEP